MDLAARAQGRNDPAPCSTSRPPPSIATGVQAGIETACALVVAEAASGELLAREDLDDALIALGMRAAETLGVSDQAPGA